jgi:DNA helicase HerA-like ATPase
LGVGEALVSMLDEEGKPGIVDRAKIVPPHSQVGAITPEQRKQIIQSSNIAGHYEKTVDRESAYEKLQARATEKASSAGAPPAPTPDAATTEGGTPSIFGTIGNVFKPTIGPRGAVHDSMATSMLKSATRAASSQMGRQIMRGILGSFMGGSRR